MLKKLKDGQRREVTPEEMDPRLRELVAKWYQGGRDMGWIIQEIWLREGVSKKNARALAEQIAFGTLKRREKNEPGRYAGQG